MHSWIKDQAKINEKIKGSKANKLQRLGAASEADCIHRQVSGDKRKYGEPSFSHSGGIFLFVSRGNSRGNSAAAALVNKVTLAAIT